MKQRPVVYLDNAATSYPKPPSVYDAVQYAMREIGAAAGRSSHYLARLASAAVWKSRQKVADLLGIKDPSRLAFTKNATESLNIVLKGWLRPGDRVLISSMEHNAVVRPVNRLKSAGLEVEKIRCRPDGLIELDDLRTKLHPPPRLVAILHASNVNGALQPVEEAAAMCRDANVALLLDAAQTAGIQPIYADSWGLGMLVCSGHKGLLGPPGVGILYIRPDLDVLPLVEGGTGSRSEDEVQPQFSPDRYESGTLNLPAIVGLCAGIEYIESVGLPNIQKHELSLAAKLENELAEIPGIQVQVPGVRGTGVVSIHIEHLNPADAGHLLDEGFGIAVRTGLHCAPLAHHTLGSFPRGTVRISPGCFTTEDELDYLIKALRKLCARR